MNDLSWIGIVLDRDAGGLAARRARCGSTVSATTADLAAAVLHLRRADRPRAMPAVANRRLHHADAAVRVGRDVVEPVDDEIGLRLGRDVDVGGCRRAGGRARTPGRSSRAAALRVQIVEVVAQLREERRIAVDRHRVVVEPHAARVRLVRRAEPHDVVRPTPSGAVAVLNTNSFVCEIAPSAVDDARRVVRVLAVDLVRRACRGSSSSRCPCELPTCAVGRDPHVDAARLRIEQRLRDTVDA